MIAWPCMAQANIPGRNRPYNFRLNTQTKSCDERVPFYFTRATYPTSSDHCMALGFE
jgi:hypothetical protein